MIFSTLICLVSNIWRAVATTYGSYMGACVLNGFGAGPAEVRPRSFDPNIRNTNIPGLDIPARDHRGHYIPARAGCLQHPLLYILLWCAHGESTQSHYQSDHRH